MPENTFSLTERYARAAERTVIVAHRGAGGLYPENTAPAMRQALALGADLIEFDLRTTKDGVPVLLHDATIDRTSDGHGGPEQYTLAELKKFNFSYCLDFYGNRGKRPVYEHLEISTFEEILAEFHGRCGMNIQVYASSENDLRTICRLYRRYDMFDCGFLALSSFDAGRTVRSIDPEVEVAILEGWAERAAPERIRACAAFGARFIQPIIGTFTADTAALCRELGIHANIFYSDTDVENRELIALGASGILTDRTDRLAATLDHRLP